MSFDEPAVVNALAFITPDDGGVTEFHGPYSFTRDGGNWETDIPVNPDDRAGINQQEAAHLALREGDLLLALADGGVHASGIIRAADIIDERLLISVNDPEWASPSEVDLDV